MNAYIRPLLFVLALGFTPALVFADDCNVSDCKGTKASDEIDCPGHGCGCYCDENGNARCKCTQPN
ncbi:hypothetical protein [Legionella quateirensis]|uniref:Uncharacterized protein n=1 Tax=Legionella quateirensis TaxID=45072 RepID=A0A378KZG0_9GAMM|nr:hypothetical protein [Legionella quateirensis]KTD46230.1 hypothetical protein Lqua_2333 [Legionella quateirensis]STY19001.1 Uncharacterised protein [Legionella quateirensis]